MRGSLAKRIRFFANQYSVSKNATHTLTHPNKEGPGLTVLESTSTKSISKKIKILFKKLPWTKRHLGISALFTVNDGVVEAIS